jgi:hypothetical protein
MVRSMAVSILLWAAMALGLAQGQTTPPTWIPTPEQRAALQIPGPEEVSIGRFRVSVPLGRILLVRKGAESCALMFTNTWLGTREGDVYTSYQFVHQGAGSGSFSASNSRTEARELFLPGTRMRMGLHVYTGAKKDTIACGNMKLHWAPIASVGSRDAELAPTSWTSFAEVNVQDPRVRWYKDDRQRTPTTVHIDRLWDAPAQRLP